MANWSVEIHVTAIFKLHKNSFYAIILCRIYYLNVWAICIFPNFQKATHFPLRTCNIYFNMIRNFPFPCEVQTQLMYIRKWLHAHYNWKFSITWACKMNSFTFCTDCSPSIVVTKCTCSNFWLEKTAFISL